MKRSVGDEANRKVKAGGCPSEPTTYPLKDESKGRKLCPGVGWRQELFIIEFPFGFFYGLTNPT